MSGVEGWSAEYITEDLLNDLESAEEPVLEDGLQTLAYISASDPRCFQARLCRPSARIQMAALIGRTIPAGLGSGARFGSTTHHWARLTGSAEPIGVINI